MPQYFSQLICSLGLLTLAVICGCGDNQPASQPPASPEQQLFYAELPGLRRSDQPWLQEEYARLRSEQALPLQLEQSLAVRPEVPAAIKPTSNAVEVQPTTSTADPNVDLKALAAIYPAFSRRFLAEQVDGIFPDQDLKLGPAELTKARDILARHREERRRFKEAFFQIKQLRIPYRDGLLTDMEVLDTAHLGGRMELLHAATLLADGSPERALESLAIVRHVISLCGSEGHLAARGVAAKLRSDVVQLVIALHNHPQLSAASRELVFELVLQDAAQWPDDSILWLGERAVGLHTYEMVRDGYYLSLLSDAEMAPLVEKNILNVTARTALRNVDSDEIFYLQSLRRIIDTSTLSYRERLKTVQAIQTEITALRDTPQFPLVAARLLLTELEAGVRLQGEERALWQGLATCLQCAYDVPDAEATQNPFTGEPYVIHDDEAKIQLEVNWHGKTKLLMLSRTSPIGGARRN